MKPPITRKVWNKMTKAEKDELISIVPLRTEENGDMIFSYESYRRTKDLIKHLNKKYKK